MMRVFSLVPLFFSLSLTEASIFGFLRGNGENADGPGVVLSNSELRLGRRGLACLQFAANVKEDPFGDLGILAGPMARVLLSNFGEEGINMVCAMTKGGRRLLAEEGGEPMEEGTEEMGNYSMDSTSESRRTQACTAKSAVYPTDPVVDTEGVYKGYADQFLLEYFPSGNMNGRSDTPTVIELIRSEIAALNEIGSGLSACSSVWSTINSIVGVADIPGVDPEMASEAINRFTCGLAYEYNSIVISRKERDLERLQFHDQLIDSAEVKAGYENSVAILEEMCSASSEAELVEREMNMIAYLL